MSRTLRIPTGSALEVILRGGEAAIKAHVDELQAIADDIERNAAAFAALPEDRDHGKVGSASAASRSFATSLRWRIQLILDEQAKRTSKAVA